MLPEPTYEELKMQYEQFRQNPPKDEFGRWIDEFKFLSALLEYAQKTNLKEDIEKFQNALNIAQQELKKFGFKG